MSYCIHCGQPSDDSLTYCPYCGKPKDVTDSGESAFVGGSPAPGASDPTADSTGSAPERSRRRGSAVPIIICAIVGAVAVGALLLVFFGPAMGIQFPWVAQEEESVVVTADESAATGSDGDAESGEETPGDSTASGSGDVDDGAIPHTPTTPQSVTGVASGDASWPYGDSSMLESYMIRSSSTLDPQSGNTYEPSNVADNDVSTCWAEGVAGLGEGEWISFENVSGSTQSVSGLEIVNGYGKQGRFEANATPVRADLYLVDGSGDAEKVAELTLMASDAPQLLKFSPSIELGPNESLRLTITESKLMSDGAEHDACISEVKILTSRDSG